MPADAVFRVGRAYGMTADRGVYQSVAVTDGRITAVGQPWDELDSFIGSGTAALDPVRRLPTAVTEAQQADLLGVDTDATALRGGLKALFD